MLTSARKHAHNDNAEMLILSRCNVYHIHQYIGMLTFVNKQKTQSTAEAEGNVILFINQSFGHVWRQAS